MHVFNFRPPWRVLGSIWTLKLFKYPYQYFFAVFWIRIRWIRIQIFCLIRIQTLCWIWIRIQAKNESGSYSDPDPEQGFLGERKLFLIKKTSYMSSATLTPTKDIQAPREASSPTGNSSNMKFFHFFVFCGQIYPAWIRIPDPNTKSWEKLGCETNFLCDHSSCPLLTWSLSPKRVRNMVKLMGPGASFIIISR